MRFLPSDSALASALTRLVPHVVYPLHHVMLTASIYTMAAIAAERYVAVHYPLDYNTVSWVVRQLETTIVLRTVFYKKCQFANMPKIKCLAINEDQLYLIKRERMTCLQGGGRKGQRRKDVSTPSRSALMN